MDNILCQFAFLNTVHSLEQVELWANESVESCMSTFAKTF